MVHYCLHKSLESAVTSRSIMPESSNACLLTHKGVAPKYQDQSTILELARETLTMM